MKTLSKKQRKKVSLKSILTTIVLGAQNALACFPATVLVALVLGISPSLALLAAGLATVSFALITKGKVPIFLGSSFAFLGGAALILENMDDTAYLGGATIVAGATYLVYALIVKLIGVGNLRKALPPVVTGTMILLIGATLSTSAVSNIGGDWRSLLVAAVTVAVTVVVAVFGKGFIKIVPVVFGLLAGCACYALVGKFDGTAIAQASFFEVPPITLPKFDLNSILILLPLTLSTFLEHIGDVEAVGHISGKDFVFDPGLPRTLIGDGVGTMISGVLGFSPNTSYSEGIATLSITKRTEPVIVWIAAGICIALSFFGKLSAVLMSIPNAVLGGLSLVLFAMIASVGLRTLVQGQVDFTNSRNIFVAGLMLIICLGGASITIGTVTIGGIALAAIAGIALNLILPKDLDKRRAEKNENTTQG